MQGSDPSPDKVPHDPFATSRPLADDSGPLLDPPRGVDAGRGFSWWGEGFELFREAPGTWVAAILLWLLLNAVLGAIPGAATLLNPVLVGGLMFGCHALASGRELALKHLFEGFRQNFGTLLRIGLLGVVGTLAILGIGVLTLVASGLDEVLWRYETPADPLAFALDASLALLVVLALSVPLAMALWFAPALAILHDLPALRSVGLSFRGCLRNLLPFLAYGIAGLGLAILATIPLGLGWLVLGPVLFTSTMRPTGIFSSSRPETWSSRRFSSTHAGPFQDKR